MQTLHICGDAGRWSQVCNAAFGTIPNNQLAGMLFENVRPALKCEIYTLSHSLYTLILMPWRHISLVNLEWAF